MRTWLFVFGAVNAGIAGATGRANIGSGMNKPFDIVLMVGIPGSGKTTFCRERLFPSHLYISLDQLRTRSAEAELFAFALSRRKPCVVDNTNVNAAERKRYIQLAQAVKDVRIVAYCFAPDLEGCIARNSMRTGRARVPELAIKGKLTRFEPPDFSEGFDEINDVEISADGFVVRRRHAKGQSWRRNALDPGFPLK